jgi:hypothetical protein
MLVTIPKTMFCRDYDRLPVTSAAAVALTAAKIVKSGVPCQLVEVIVEGAEVRRMNSGGTPTTGASGNGAPMRDGDTFLLQGGQAINNLKFIAVSDASVVHVHYYYEK